MNMAELCRNVAFHKAGYLKTTLMAIASAVGRMVLSVDPNFEKDQTNNAENLIIHDRLIPSPLIFLWRP